MTDGTKTESSDSKTNPEAELEAALDAQLDDLQADEAEDGNKSITPGAAALVQLGDGQVDRIADSIKVKSPRNRPATVPVHVVPSKRTKLNQLLELMAEFEYKELKSLLKVDKRRRKAEKLQNKNQTTLSGLLGN